MAKNEINYHLIKQAVLARRANRRQSPASTKTRGEVSGGGAKPWRQKGTGRARAGSRRSPIWVGGGITFGPRSIDNYHQKLPKKMSQRAFEELLNLKKAQHQYQEVESLNLKEPKTKAAVTMLAKICPEPKEKIVLVTEKLEPELRLAVNNLPSVETFEASQLTIDHLFDSAHLIIEKKAVKIIEERLGTTPKPVTTKTPATKTTKIPPKTAATEPKKSTRKVTQKVSPTLKPSIKAKRTTKVKKDD